MIRFYSLFVTDDDLLSSPYIQKFNLFHDITLQRGHEETVNFLLQTPLTPAQSNKLNIISDPQSLEIKDTEVKTYKHQSLISITLIPKEVGSARIGITFPQSESLHGDQLKNLPARFISTPCDKVHQTPFTYSPKKGVVSSHVTPNSYIEKKVPTR
jgi:hypothetical protein